MTFKQWLSQYVNENSHIGDLAEEITADKIFPQTNDCAEVLKYLTDKNVDQFHIRTFEKAWKRYIHYILSDTED